MSLCGLAISQTTEALDAPEPLLIGSELAITRLTRKYFRFLPTTCMLSPAGQPDAVSYSNRRSLINVSVLAYFAPLRETRMPRATSQPDPLIINWLTVCQAFEKSDSKPACRRPQHRAPHRRGQGSRGLHSG